MASADQTAATKAVPKLENTEKRDTLIADELRFQEEWETKGLFRQDAPGPDELKPPKYFATMAYPWYVIKPLVPILRPSVDRRTHYLSELTVILVCRPDPSTSTMTCAIG